MPDWPTKADGSGESGGWGRPIKGCTDVDGTGGGGGALYVVAARIYCAEFAPDRGMNEERRDEGIGEVSRPILLPLGFPALLGVRVLTVVQQSWPLGRGEPLTACGS